MVMGRGKLTKPTAHLQLHRIVGMTRSRRDHSFTDGILGKLSNGFDILFKRNVLTVNFYGLGTDMEGFGYLI
jgi:hypothetical protein